MGSQGCRIISENTLQNAQDALLTPRPMSCLRISVTMKKPHFLSINVERIRELSKVRYTINFPDYLVFFPVLIYFALAFIKIYQPGIQYDEILFGNAARNVIDAKAQSFIWFKIGNFPVLILSYIGSMKAYFFYLIFKCYGVSAYTIRLPMILLSALTIIIMYKALYLYFNKQIALITVTLIAVDPSFLSFTRYDVGPSVIEFSLKILCIYLFILFLDNNKNKYLYIYFVFSCRTI
jgi:hypothetical protein